MGMPLGRYFVFVGSLLLALLFLADWYFPKLVAMPARADVDRTIIRLHSAHRWPEAIVFDTSLPTIVPPPQIADARALPSAAERPSPKQSLAMMEPAPASAAVNVAVKRVHKRRTRTARVRVPNYQIVGFRDSVPAGW